MFGDKSNNNETYRNITDNLGKNNGTKKDDDKAKVEEDPGTYLIEFFVLFFFIGLYMICKMKEYEQTKIEVMMFGNFNFLQIMELLVVKKLLNGVYYHVLLYH